MANMRTVNPYSLVSDKASAIEMTETEIIPNCFEIWKELSREKNIPIRMMDAFIVGYFLGKDSELRSKYLKLIKDKTNN